MGVGALRCGSGRRDGACVCLRRTRGGGHGGDESDQKQGMQTAEQRSLDLIGIAPHKVGR